MPQFTEGPVNADFTGVLQVCFIFAKSNLQFPSIGNQKELLSGGFIKKYIFADLLTPAHKTSFSGPDLAARLAADLPFSINGPATLKLSWGVKHRLANGGSRIGF